MERGRFGSRSSVITTRAGTTTVCRHFSPKDEYKERERARVVNSNCASRGGKLFPWEEYILSEKEELCTFCAAYIPPPPPVSSIPLQCKVVGMKWSAPPSPSEYSCTKSSTSSSNCNRERVLNSTGGNLEELNVQGLQPGTTYELRVVAHNEHGSGESSEPLRVRSNVYSRRHQSRKFPSLPCLFVVQFSFTKGSRAEALGGHTHTCTNIR